MESYTYAPTDWSAFAGEDDDYRCWLERADQVCDQFLDIQLEGLVSSRELDPLEEYVTGMTAEEFVKRCVVPYLELEHGAGMIYELIEAQLMWGRVDPPFEDAHYQR